MKIPPSLTLVILLHFGTGLVSPVSAQAPRLLPFQARLTDASGQPVPDGPRLVQFQIFGEPIGGAALWAGETHRVTINGGLVNVLLGSKNPLPTDRLDDPSRSFFDATLYLQVTVDANGDGRITDADPPLLPRQAIVPVVFAAEAGLSRTSRVSQVSLDSAKLAGRDWSDLLTTADPRTGQLPAGKLTPSSVSAAQLAGEVAEALVPPGTVIAWMGTDVSAVPAGWDLCWGQEVSRQGKYSRLFGIIGTSCGAGDGAATFRLPDLRAMFLRGVNAGRNDAFADQDAAGRSSESPGGSSGDAVGSVEPDSFRRHRHGIGGSKAQFLGGGPLIYLLGNLNNEGDIGFEGGSETRPNNVNVQYLIKL